MLKRYEITGMKCQGCVDTVTQKLSQVMGVEKVAVDLENSQVSITGNPFKFLVKSALKGTKFQLGSEVKTDSQ